MMHMRNRTGPVLLAFIAVLALGACQSKRATTRPGTGGDAVAATGAAGDAATSSADIGTAGSVGMQSGSGAGPTGELAQKRIVYFDFDSSELRAGDQAIVAAHARWLAANPTAKVRLEGHTDERGTREYNIALGERRAQAVRRALTLQGVGEAQAAAVSFGEERPAVAGEDETAFAQNRRVEFVYGN
jgi:peptidoglycan-associated lipoprotein